MSNAATREEMARLLTAVASLANHMMLMASAPAGKWAYERSSNPQPGDLVVEMTHREWSPACVGWLEKIADEPMYDAAEWDEAEEGRPIPLDRRYYVRPLTGGPVVRWENCRFIALPVIERGDEGAGRWGERTTAAIEWHRARDWTPTAAAAPTPPQETQR